MWPSWQGAPSEETAVCHPLPLLPSAPASPSLRRSGTQGSHLRLFTRTDVRRPPSASTLPELSEPSSVDPTHLVECPPSASVTQPLRVPASLRPQLPGGPRPRAPLGWSRVGVPQLSPALWSPLLPSPFLSSLHTLLLGGLVHSFPLETAYLMMIPKPVGDSQSIHSMAHRSLGDQLRATLPSQAPQ